MTQAQPTPPTPPQRPPMNLTRMLRVWFLLVLSMAVVAILCLAAMPQRPPREPPKGSGPEAADDPLATLVWPTDMTPSSRWRFVILHHTATPSATLEAITRYHRDHLNVEGTAYHFLIHNGRAAGTRDGQIEPTPRWLAQQDGAHCYVQGHPEYSRRGIGVCLVGHFGQEEPTPAQMASLTRLVNLLRRRYDMPLEHVLRHGELKETECPGQKFPMEALVMQLRRAHLEDEGPPTGPADTTGPDDD